jgi:heparan-alpha-glucosaminide N-acetyltransferase
VRVRSIDLLRGADVLLMLFVNEAATVQGAPAFAKHAPAAADAMTAADVVFPAFLFIVGIAVPFALGGRLQRGEARAAIWRHVLTRTAALLTMGVFTVNAEFGDGGILPTYFWNLLMSAGVLLVWGVGDEGWGRLEARWLRRAGVLLLVGLALAYRSHEASGWLQLRPHWWGILGLIGWAYLAAASAYLLVGERPSALAALVALLSGIAVADGMRTLGPWAVRPLFGQFLGSHSAVAIAGLLLGVLLRKHVRERTAARSLGAQALLLACALAGAGLLLHSRSALDPALRFSKIHATVPWALVSAAITCAAWLALFLLADVAGWRRWPRSLTIAGENPLLAYLIAPMVLSLLALSAPWCGGTSPYDALAENATLGVARSIVFAWLVVRLCGFLRTRGVCVQL